ncbi:MAG: hypothetical protein V4474_01230 [Patescibacteria group bacterium]
MAGRYKKYKKDFKPTIDDIDNISDTLNNGSFFEIYFEVLDDIFLDKKNIILNNEIKLTFKQLYEKIFTK